MSGKHVGSVGRLADAALCQQVADERLKLSDALAGPILVQEGPGDAPETLAPVADFGPGSAFAGALVGSAWRGRGFGSSSQLAPPAPASPAHSHSASSLHLRRPHAHPPAHRHPLRAPPAPPLSDALFSSSTSDLEKLKRNRILPALSRHRNTEHLHLSDERLDAAPRPRNLEVGSERRQRRIEKIAEMEHSRLFRFGDFADARRPEPAPAKEDDKVRQILLLP